MSYYDLTKNFVLSAKELFKYRLKRDNTIPSKGGQKDFEPDGSWAQTKALDVFMQERTSVLAEPRVEKLKNLVEGVWDEEDGLVNLRKPGKFWAHMGFTDQRRNYLFPEEALFLMECNTLEVTHHGVPLSIQEGYNLFLSEDVTIEDYQVFAHLRRLGYVVLRHESQPVITPYEKQINLDKYMSKKNLKDRKGKLQKMGKKSQQSKKVTSAVTANSTDQTNVEDMESTGNGDNEEPTSRDKETEEAALVKEKDSSPSSCLANPESSSTNTDKSAITSSTTSKDFVQNEPRKRHASSENESSESCSKRLHLDEEGHLEEDQDIIASTALSNEMNTDSDQISSQQKSTSCQGFYADVWTSCLQSCKKQETLTVTDKTDSSKSSSSSSSTLETESTMHPEKSLEHSFQNSAVLPDIANQTLVNLHAPEKRLLPPSIELDADENEALLFDVEEYREKNPPKEMSRQAAREEERDTRVQGLKFSFAEWTQRKPKVMATNWAEYKQKIAERFQEITSNTPVDHLWSGKVKPLVKPEDATSNQSILNRLSIIQSADNETLLPDSDCVVDVKITYDVHLPDSRFKKSMPGTPNHRVCVAKCSADPPGLAEIQQAWSRFKDGVPLHWAVVDSGEIAFYVFDNLHSLEVLP